MKKLFLVVVVVVGLAVWWFKRTPPRDPHYDAAACVAVDVMGKAAPDTDSAFLNKIRTVIDNENSDYSVSKVKFSESVAMVSIKRYQSLSSGQKAIAGQNLDSCINVMAAGPSEKANQQTNL
ncbi:hypothetical protein [Rouxiella badensis]|uniref:Uncharacterized protein n=2 Tax=Rouxiella badensis TaxID=1646377 RepID=A0A1X0WA22_9GAMM|nr:hypothetical protein [Rouxiella badensis]ORJ23614.1 hypothetical protein BS640_20375 [Rouxiella badensis]